MSRRIQTLMSQSRKGSFSALSDLSEAIGSDVGLLVEALPIVFQHLRLADIPQEPFPWTDSSTGKDAESGRRTVLCLEILQVKLSKHLDRRNESLTPAVRSSILTYLDKLWPAAEFLLGRIGRRGMTSSAELVFQHNLHATIVDIFFVLVNDLTTLAILLSHPRILTALVKIWMLEVDFEVIGPNKSASTVIAAAILNDPDNVPFPQGMRGSEQKFASFLLNQLDDGVGAENLEMILIRGVVMVMHAWSYHENDPYLSFIEAGSIRSICNLLHRLSSSRDFSWRLNSDQHNTGLIYMVYQAAMRYLSFCINVTGHQAILEAIDHRLVLSLVRCREILHDDRLEFLTTYTELFHRIESCLVYPKVLRRAGKSISAIRRRQLDITHSGEPQPSPVFQDLWGSFMSSYEDRSAYKTKRDLTLRPESSRCHNPSHNKIGSHGHRFRVCSGCYRTYYCSRACQKAHWKTGEDKTCMTNRQPKGSESNMRPSDYAFLSDMMKHDLQRARDDGSLEATADLYYLEHSDLDPRTLLGVIDYFEGKHSLRVTSQAAFREAEGFDAGDKDPEHIQGMNQIMADARRGLGFLVAFKIRIPSSIPWIPMRIVPTESSVR
ncbi:hypothetical protein C8J56DRAFT_1164060 [Mycena floridula]|nr:hypothetical protein C8J56DRAFT_1164060 [Mycena floridula]